MPALFVKVRVDPAHRGEILDALVADGLGSLRDETGTLRFDVLADQADLDVLYFYEVYPNEAAFDVHRAGAHDAAGMAVLRRLRDQGVLTTDVLARADGVFVPLAAGWTTL